MNLQFSLYQLLGASIMIMMKTCFLKGLSMQKPSHQVKVPKLWKWSPLMFWSKTMKTFNISIQSVKPSLTKISSRIPRRIVCSQLWDHNSRSNQGPAKSVRAPSNSPWYTKTKMIWIFQVYAWPQTTKYLSAVTIRIPVYFCGRQINLW